MDSHYLATCRGQRLELRGVVSNKVPPVNSHDLQNGYRVDSSEAMKHRMEAEEGLQTFLESHPLALSHCRLAVVRLLVQPHQLRRLVRLESVDR